MHRSWRVTISVLPGAFYGFLVVAFNRAPSVNDVLLYCLAFCLPVSILTILTYVWLTDSFGKTAAEQETRCRKCGYILRGITEPRCPECGERI